MIDSKQRSFVAPVELLESRVVLAGGQPLVDINLNTLDSNPTPLVSIGGRTVIIATTPATGLELFITSADRTSATLLTELSPGSGSMPNIESATATVLGGRLIFWTLNGSSPDRLMSVQLAGGATTTLLDANDLYYTNTTANIAVLNGSAYFHADGAAGRGLYRTDGTITGTQFVLAVDTITGLQAHNNTLFVVGNSALQRLESDNTLTRLSPVGVSVTGSMQSVGSEVWFTAGAANPWRSDGTAAGTREVANIGDSYDGFLVDAVRLTNGRVVFSTGYGGTLYSIDTAGAVTGPLSNDNVYDLLAVDGSAYYGTYDSSTRYPAVYATGGTLATTRLIKVTEPAPTDLFGIRYAAPRYLTSLGNGKFAFSGYTSANGYEPWISDGTASGTKLLKDLNPGTDGSAPRGAANAGGANDGPRLFNVESGKLLFTATTAATGAELWSTDGTASGTAQLFDLNTATRDGLLSNPIGTNNASLKLREGVLFNGKSYFVADDGVHGDELWVTDGSAAGTKMVIDLTPGKTGSSVGSMIVNNGALYFIAKAIVYKTDGTSAGTVALSNGYYVADTDVPNPLVIYRGRVTFYGASSVTYPNPAMGFWSTDGTAAGTRQMSPSFSNTTAGPYTFAVAGEGLYFVYSNYLYRYNGSTNTISLIDQVSYRSPFKAYGNGMLAYASPVGLVVRDDAAGTNTTVPTSDVYDIEAIGADLYASIYDAGTYPLTRFNPTTKTLDRVGPTFAGWPAQQLSTVGNRLFFFADANGGGMEPWVSDGTAAGTQTLGDLNPGSLSSYVSGYPNPTHSPYFTAADGTAKVIYFQATSAATGTELYQTDGSAAGTKLVADFVPGPADSLPGPFLHAGGKLFVAVQTPLIGREWIDVTPMPPTGSISGVVFDDTNADGTRQLSESPLGGETVYLDLNGNSQTDAGEPTALSTAAGYTFLNVNVGTYTVRLQAPVGGRRTTTPGVSSVVTVSEGNTATAGAAFGVTSLPGTAVIGGSTTVAEGSAVTLDGSASFEPFGTIVKYEWDFNYTGTTFDIDATGIAPTFDAGQIDGPATRGVGLRVTDANGLVSFVTKTLISITNVAPTGGMINLGPVAVGSPVFVGFKGPTDPSPADRASIAYSFDFNNDGDFTDPGDVAQGSNFAGTFTYPAAGTYTVHGRVSDKDGGFSDAYTTVLIYPAPTTANPASTLLEAENATFAGGTAKASGNGGYTGTGYADFGGINSSAQWSLTRNAAGAATLSFRYANGGTTNRPLSIVVNGATIGSVACVPTGAWTTWASVSIDAALIAGANTVKAVASTSVGGANVDSLTVLTKPAAPPAWLSGSADAAYTLSGNTLVVTAGTVTLLSDAGLASPGLTVVVGNGAKVIANTSQHLGTLGIAGRFTMATGGGKLLRVTALSVADSDGLDLTDNDLIIDYSGTPPLAEVRQLLTSGRAAGGWTGTGVRSSAAAANPGRTLGYISAADYFAINGPSSAFDGETIDATSVLVKYTFAGDATLDGQVDFNDFLRLQNGFGSSGGGFAGGDFDYDGKTDFNDFLALQNNFGATTAVAVKPTVRR